MISSPNKNIQDYSHNSDSFTLSLNDIEIICKICDIAWTNFFSQPLPGYNKMQVYSRGKLHFFNELDLNDQIEVIKSAHVAVLSPSELEGQKTPSEIQNIIQRLVLFSEGHLLLFHGIGHAVRTAVIAFFVCCEYSEAFAEFDGISSRVFLCSVVAALLHDIGRCFGGDGTDIFGATSAFVAGEILTKVGGFSDDEIEWVKEAIEIGGIDENDVKKIRERSQKSLSEKEMIACIMGDADSYEFERFRNCDVSYTCVKKLGLLKKNGQKPDGILSLLKTKARDLSMRISEPGSMNNKFDYSETLRIELLKAMKS